MRLTIYKMKIDRKANIPYLDKEISKNYPLDSLREPESTVHVLNFLFDACDLAEEHLWALCLDVNLRVVGIFEVTHGLGNLAVFSPREIFMRALMVGAYKIIIAHNHPSGETEPSREDDAATQDIRESGKLLGIELLDHIIIGKDNYFSYASGQNFPYEKEEIKK